MVGDDGGSSLKVWIALWGPLPDGRRILLVKALDRAHATRSASRHWPDLGPPLRIVEAGAGLTARVLSGRALRSRVGVAEPCVPEAG